MTRLYSGHFSRYSMLYASEIKLLPKPPSIQAIFLKKIKICKALMWKTLRWITCSVCFEGRCELLSSTRYRAGWSCWICSSHSWLEDELPGGSWISAAQNEPCFLSYYKCFRLVLFVSGAEYQQWCLKWQIIATEGPCVA